MIDYFRPEEKDMKELEELYLECFDDDREIADFIFKFFLLPKYAFAARKGNEIVAALYHLPGPYSLGDGSKVKMQYVFGAGTKEKYRGRGIMSGLIKYSNYIAKRENFEYSVLCPASDKLYDYYAKLGYKKYYYSSYFDFVPAKMLDRGIKPKRMAEISAQTVGKRYSPFRLTKISFDICFRLRFNICMAIRGSVCWSRRHLAACTALNRLSGGGSLMCPKGYAVYRIDDPKGKEVFVEELMCEPKYADAILLGVALKLNADRLRVRCPQYVHDGELRPMGMVLPLKKKNLTDRGAFAPYLGLSLD